MNKKTNPSPLFPSKKKKLIFSASYPHVESDITTRHSSDNWSQPRVRVPHSHEQAQAESTKNHQLSKRQKHKRAARQEHRREAMKSQMISIQKKHHPHGNTADFGLETIQDVKKKKKKQKKDWIDVQHSTKKLEFSSIV